MEDYKPPCIWRQRDKDGVVLPKTEWNNNNFSVIRLSGVDIIDKIYHTHWINKHYSEQYSRPQAGNWNVMGMETSNLGTNVKFGVRVEKPKVSIWHRNYVPNDINK